MRDLPEGAILEVQPFMPDGEIYRLHFAQWQAWDVRELKTIQDWVIDRKLVLCRVWLIL